jgi:hypothetical protein
MSDHRGRAASTALLLLCAGLLLGSDAGGPGGEYELVSPSADTAGALFGTSMAAAGHTSSGDFEDLVVGAPGHALASGAVRVYTGQLDLGVAPRARDGFKLPSDRVASARPCLGLASLLPDLGMHGCLLATMRALLRQPRD